MHRSLLAILIDPIAKTPLTLEECQEAAGDEILTGKLRGDRGRWYPIRNGIPRLVVAEDPDQEQTAESFGFKWSLRDTYDSAESQARYRDWLVQRYGFHSAAAMRDFFTGRCRILDAGCGSGFASYLWMAAAGDGSGGPQWLGVDISTAVDVARERLGLSPSTQFLQADILRLPLRNETFDTIFSEGVLHHTPSTRHALEALLAVLEPGGEILFYVYRKKGPIREFTDDHIRSVISRMAPAEAWEALRPLTRLGEALAKLRVQVDVPEDIPYLGIRAGRSDVQRLVYWNFAKLFWNDALSFEENHHINFDWYHPRYAHRHTEEEVRAWCAESNLEVAHFDAQESGFSVRAIKR